MRPAAVLHAQNAVTEGAARKTATIARIQAGSIRLDGRLDDEGWRPAEPVTDFTQKEPTEGAPATERMEVRQQYLRRQVVLVAARPVIADAGNVIFLPRLVISGHSLT